MKISALSILNTTARPNMPKIHLIEKESLVRCIDIDLKYYETGYWAVSNSSATQLINGDLFLHKSQNSPSFFGGKIISFRIVDLGEYKGRVAFVIEASMKHKGIYSGASGWGNEKKIEL